MKISEVLLQPLQREGSEHQMVNVGMPHGRRVVIPDDQDFRTNHEKNTIYHLA